MRERILGIDTSNYTTSAAVLENGGIVQSKKLLPVREGELGLRQSDAVFHHVRQLPEVLSPLLSGKESVTAIGVSDRPRSQEHSYMPCFTAGTSFARSIGDAMGVPVTFFSHQEGHLAAALYSAGRLDLVERSFLAFHVSGGTTEGVYVTPGKERIWEIRIAAQSLDLKAGQAVDRCGKLLGLPFPAGKELEKLALRCESCKPVRPVMKEQDCSLSGIENHCEKMLRDGIPPEEIARYCIEAIGAALSSMCEKLLAQYGELPVLFAGGVSSNTILREQLTSRFGALFAAPEFSCDNAAGVAILASRSGR